MGARARSFPHVEGNYATHVRAPAGAMARDGALGAALRALGAGAVWTCAPGRVGPFHTRGPVDT